MDQAKNIVDIGRRMIGVLEEAKAHFLNDKPFYERTGISEQALCGMLDEVMREFAREIYESVVAQKGSVALAPGRHGVQVDRSCFNANADFYVIVPISGTTPDGEIYNCLLSAIHNLRGLNFSLIIILNQKEKSTIEFLRDRGVNHIIFESTERISLPSAYNLAIGYLRNDMVFVDGIVSFMDDDAFIIGDQRKEILSNFERVRNDPFTLIASGHYYDIRCLPSYFFQSIAMTNDVDYASLVRKPYSHGGAFLSMNIKNYPKDGLTEEGLGGINISISQINNIPDHELDKMAKAGQWFLYNNHRLMVFHKLKESVIQWTATYLSYELAWSYGLGQLDTRRKEMWSEKLKEGSLARYEYLLDIIERKDDRSKFAVGCILLTKYYKPLLRSNFEYREFSDFIQRSHVNLK